MGRLAIAYADWTMASVRSMLAAAATGNKLHTCGTKMPANGKSFPLAIALTRLFSTFDAAATRLQWAFVALRYIGPVASELTSKRGTVR